jgi:hypothetical protein
MADILYIKFILSQIHEIYANRASNNMQLLSKPCFVQYKTIWKQRAKSILSLQSDRANNDHWWYERVIRYGDRT